jgi:glycosyltransferase involved in cell wall biosynthesis
VAALGPGGAARAAGGLVRSLVRGSTPGARNRLLRAPLAGTDADIIHFEFSGIAVQYRDVLASLRPARFVVSCRGSAEQLQPRVDPTRADALRELFGRVDLIHCVSAAMGETVQQFGADPAKILVNRPAVPVELLAPLADRRVPHDGPLRVLAIGRLQWVKGYDDALRAVAKARAAGCDIELRIVGEGPDRDKVTYLVDVLGLEGSVTLVGAQSQAEVREHLVWADTLLLSSLSEGISNAVLEAMASGIPAVTTDCGGMEEVVTSGVDGFVVPVGDIDAMAERLAELAEDPDRRAALGAAAARRASAEFGLARQVDGFIEAYRQLGERP